MISSQIGGEFTAVLLIYAFDMRHFDVEVFLRAFKRDGPQGYAGACVSLYKQKDTIWNLSLELSRNLQNKITQGLADVTILIYIYIYNVGSSVVYALFMCCFPTRACRMRRVQIHHHHLKKKTKSQ